MLAFTDADLNAFLDNAHTVACALLAGWIAYRLLSR